VTELNSDHPHPGGEYRIVLPEWRPLPPYSQRIGRAPRMHFLTGIDQYQFEVGHIAA
jgi:hypothetical protein